MASKPRNAKQGKSVQSRRGPRSAGAGGGAGAGAGRAAGQPAAARTRERKRTASVQPAADAAPEPAADTSVRDAAMEAEGLVVYIHGIGRQPPAPVIKLDWDLALFGRDREQATVMAYWSDIVHPVSKGAAAYAARATHPEGPADDEADDRLEPAEILEEAGVPARNRAAARAYIDALLAQHADEPSTPRRRGPRAKVLPLPAFMRKPIARGFLKLFVRDTAAYFFNAENRRRMRDRLIAVLPEDDRVPVTLVAHSQGSIIALEVLAARKGPLDWVKLVTIGSPLGLTEVQDNLDVPRDRYGRCLVPRVIQRWHNFADPLDPIALDKGLRGDFVEDPYQDETGVWRSTSVMDELVGTWSLGNLVSHAGVGYLAHPKVRRAVYEAAQFDTMSRFVVARDVAERLSAAQRQPLLIEVLEPGYEALGELTPQRKVREAVEAGPNGAPLRLADRVARAAEDVRALVLLSAAATGETGAVENARVDVLRRYVAAHLTPAEIREVAQQHQRFNVYAVWRSTSKKKLITRSRAVLQADAAYESYGARGAGITWAVLDTGICSAHPHFAGRISAIWDCTKSGRPELLPHDKDRDGHGSHVAGIIAGAGEANGQTFLGVAPEAKLVIYKVLNDSGEGEDAWIIKALDHIAEQNDNKAALTVHGLNLSLGGPYDATVYGCGFTPICQELRRLWRSGVLVVVASGNEGQLEVKTSAGEVEINSPMSIGDPANLEDCIAVGSVHADRPHLYGVSSFSSRGPTSDGRCKPDVVAPGERISSVNARFEKGRVDHYYRVESGTSMAAPHVSGLLASFLSVRREFRGRPDEVKRLLLETCTDIGRDRHHQGRGIPNLMKMLLSV